MDLRLAKAASFGLNNLRAAPVIVAGWIAGGGQHTEVLCL